AFLSSKALAWVAALSSPGVGMEALVQAPRNHSPRDRHRGVPAEPTHARPATGIWRWTTFLPLLVRRRTTRANLVLFGRGALRSVGLRFERLAASGIGFFGHWCRHCSSCLYNSGYHARLAIGVIWLNGLGYFTPGFCGGSGSGSISAFGGGDGGVGSGSAASSSRSSGGANTRGAGATFPAPLRRARNASRIVW